ncbi:MAG: molecular chaperone Tir [Desulfobacteraceae bacterium 4572_130]|nr:MAG: molecular chaperone Tir [Desulfobacteraceae bacterium 4572_130]
MQDKFNLIKEFLNEMEISIIKEDKTEELVIVEDEENGIKNLVIDCEAPIVVLEQIIMKVPNKTDNLYKRLLQLNRELVHGAFVIDENENYVIFRDTLQLENLDRNELEASIHALSLALSEYGAELLGYIKK